MVIADENQRGKHQGPASIRDSIPISISIPIPIRCSVQWMLQMSVQPPL